MRAWKTTLALAIAAALAALIAPRLLATRQAPTEPRVLEVTTPIATPDLTIPEIFVRPAKPAIAEVPEVHQLLPPPPIQPVDTGVVRERDWDDCPACGMG
ncbi:MAG: hypothetical protein KC656_24060 [Myxococcales bacterium]|nr:hypothetical protein [Myxococcales bacterium]MCB9671505.1 hypothetical protein [Alphaproteobacteria bacterium]